MKNTFQKIIDNELPSYKVYEDDVALAFLDTEPVSQGHTLVIPKHTDSNIFTIEQDTLSHLMLISQKVAQAQQAAFNHQNIKIFFNNGSDIQEIDHLHIHITNPAVESYYEKFESAEQLLNTLTSDCLTLKEEVKKL